MTPEDFRRLQEFLELGYRSEVKIKDTGHYYALSMYISEEDRLIVLEICKDKLYAFKDLECMNGY